MSPALRQTPHRGSSPRRPQHRLDVFVATSEPYQQRAFFSREAVFLVGLPSWAASKPGLTPKTHPGPHALESPREAGKARSTARAATCTTTVVAYSLIAFQSPLRNFHTITAVSKTT